MLKDKYDNDRECGVEQCSASPSCCKGCCKRTCCCVCPPGPPRPGTFSGVQAQLQGASSGLLGNHGNVLFDKVINQSNPDIGYDKNTGEFTLPPNRNYYVSWEVAIDGTELVQSVDFGVAVNHAVIAVGSSAQVTCLFSGTALVSAGREPEKLTIVNISKGTVRYAAASVQANIVIVGLA